MKKFKKGAASFYIVAFSTLILLIIAASFAAIIISEITRTSNDDLAQSAYDSALAGVEDAKLAFYNYRNCKAEKKGECDTVLEAMETKDCNMVSRMLFKEDNKEVLVEESTEENRGNNMSQAYTCVKIEKDLPDYRGSSSPSEPVKVIKVKFSSYEKDDKEVAVHASMIKRVKVSWYSVENSTTSGFNPTNATPDGVVFDSLNSESSSSTPPTISFALVQAGSNFKLDDFDVSKGDRTNRGMIYLVPSKYKEKAASSDPENNYNSTTYDEVNLTNTIGASALVKSNNKVVNNKPYMIYCDPDFESEFACSATIDLPKPVNGERDDENFYIVLGFPYSDAIDYALEFFCDEVCMVETETLEDENGNTTTETKDTTQAYLDSVQIKVDSTGRANDMFRRVEARLESPDNFMSVMGPLELLGNDDGSDGGSLLDKSEPVLCEWNFPRNC